MITEAANDVIVEPWSAALRLLMRRAADRHQIADTAAIDTLAQVIPEMAAYRSLTQRKPFELAFLTALVDDVLLPALSIAPPTKEDRS
ncbi:TetR/AcrR family transcriptional regulator C-terminal ligand-binding domain-containing protein [Mycolicibacterium crocinum]|uniref:TetR/AcrR family transcriptional regulator C-terminal ligand-binding domain-containing protein n=1 Tax=Mycolicibacterium crocinum TaxID=388459 RepID=A0ABY3TJU9_9MYCO|nr:TetR/AcrR family transcriptional regulator C-terminal ligand-binding domain-containing protein [Mycolicibacterium crocinum]ULN41730.1 TetR/AcrR family transcriptional regulator C-terminal ligand-binding domain-containing protein [Mycolicibacterium crocinum]